MSDRISRDDFSNDSGHIVSINDLLRGREAFLPTVTSAAKRFQGAERYGDPTKIL